MKWKEKKKCVIVDHEAPTWQASIRLLQIHKGMETIRRPAHNGLRMASKWLHLAGVSRFYALRMGMDTVFYILFMMSHQRKRRPTTTHVLRVLNKKRYETRGMKQKKTIKWKRARKWMEWIQKISKDEEYRILPRAVFFQKQTFLPKSDSNRWTLEVDKSLRLKNLWKLLPHALWGGQGITTVFLHHATIPSKVKEIPFSAIIFYLC